MITVTGRKGADVEFSMKNELVKDVIWDDYCRFKDNNKTCRMHEPKLAVVLATNERAKILLAPNGLH